MSELPAVFIAGPTASGKTALAMSLADRLDVCLISVDAAQVYRGMNIGTAKLDAAALRHYPHALIDIRDPAEVYDVAQFVDDACGLISSARARGRLPVLVGGSQFYFSALEKGVSRLPQADPEIRARLDKQANAIGWEGLHRRLMSVDVSLGQKIDVADRQRIQRALEIYEIRGMAPSRVMADALPQPLQGGLLKFNLYTPDRSLLHQRIRVRFDNMLNAGLMDEVAQLKNRGDLNLDLPSMRCVGYRQVWQYLAGVLDYDSMQEKAHAATRQLAKRQLTWLRHQRGQIWLSSEFNRNVELILRFLA